MGGRERKGKTTNISLKRKGKGHKITKFPPKRRKKGKMFLAAFFWLGGGEKKKKKKFGPSTGRRRSTFLFSGGKREC